MLVQKPKNTAPPTKQTAPRRRRHFDQKTQVILAVDSQPIIDKPNGAEQLNTIDTCNPINNKKISIRECKFSI